MAQAPTCLRPTVIEYCYTYTHVMVNLFYIFKTLVRVSGDICYINGSSSFYCLEFSSSSHLGNFLKDNLATTQNTGCSSDIYLKYTQKEIDIFAVFGYDGSLDRSRTKKKKP